MKRSYMSTAAKRFRTSPPIVGGAAVLLVFAMSISALSYSRADADKGRVDVRNLSDGQIEELLLSFTPIGTSVAAVHRFVRDKLHHLGTFPSVAPTEFPVNLAASIGSYREARSFYLFPTLVQAFCYFDRRGESTKIEVRRLTVEDQGQ